MASMKDVVDQGSRTKILDGFVALKGHAPRMLSAANPLATDDGTIWNNVPIVETHLPEYLASASLLHAEDSLSYLGRSLGAMQVGNLGGAYHFAYYAELRAALSILASSGVLIRNKRVGSIDAAGAYHSRSSSGGGTHVFAWRLVTHWFSSREATQMLRHSFAPFGLSLDDWMDAANLAYGQAIQPVAEKWLKAWSIDLKQFNKDPTDRSRRNRLSYNPTRHESFPTINIEDFTLDFWELCEPMSLGRLDTFDQLLLELLVREIREVAQAQDPATLVQCDATFKAEITQQNPASGWDQNLFQAPTTRLHPIFERAKETGFDPRTAFSRATILSRIACASVYRNVIDALGHAHPAVDEWARQLLKERGIQLDPSDDFNVLWDAIDLNLEDMVDQDDPVAPRSDGVGLDTTELICAWAIAT